MDASRRFPRLPKHNWQMTKEQLSQWQRSAMYECECENVYNRTIQFRDHVYQVIERRRQNRQRRQAERLSPSLELSAIDAAIDTLGLQAPNPQTRNSIDAETENDAVDESAAPPPAQRKRLQ